MRKNYYHMPEFLNFIIMIIRAIYLKLDPGVFSA